MFVEGDLEIKIKDRAAAALDEHDLKLWLQRSFRDMCCYRIANFAKTGAREVKATLTLKITHLPEDERVIIETHPNDAGLLRSFMERMFEGKGVARAVGTPTFKKQ